MNWIKQNWKIVIPRLALSYFIFMCGWLVSLALFQYHNDFRLLVMILFGLALFAWVVNPDKSFWGANFRK